MIIIGIVFIVAGILEFKKGNTIQAIESLICGGLFIYSGIVIMMLKNDLKQAYSLIHNTNDKVKSLEKRLDKEGK